MLKTITLENYVHFKDEIVIDFDAPNKTADENRQQTNDGNGQQTTNENEQKMTDENKEETVACSSLHIFVGANFCGKSTIIELIRRCMTDEINLSKTNLCLEDSVAYAFCKFDDEIISGIIAEPHQKKSRLQTEYKFFIYDKGNETFFRYKSNNCADIRGAVVTDDTDRKVLRNLFGRKPDKISRIENRKPDKTRQIKKRKPDKTSQIEKNNNHKNIINLLKLIKKTKTCFELHDKPSWHTIENQYIASFPLRGIGIVQWTKSAKIKDKSNYKKACERAEVISTLFRKNQFDEQVEKEIFDFITYPNVYTFTQNNGYICVQKDGLKFHLLKTSEGILEAKLTSLLLAYTGIKTLCLEEPDRGMHPQMIERLKTVLFREARTKTIIVVTHSPYFIDNITIKNTHVFFRKKHSNMPGIDSMRCLLKPQTSSNTCSPRKVRSFPDLSKVPDIEKKRCLLLIRAQTSDFKTRSLKKARSCPELSKVSKIETMRSLMLIRKPQTDSNSITLKKARSSPELSNVPNIEKMQSLGLIRKHINNICYTKKVSCTKIPKTVSDIETIRTLLFATKVLLVEGQIDKEVVQGIFAQYKNKKLTESEIGEFITDITTYQVISLEGCDNAKKVQTICDEIHLPCLCLLDLDTIVKYKGDKNSTKTTDLPLPWGYRLKMSLKRNTNLITGFKKIDNQQHFKEKYVGKSISSFIAHDDSLKVVKSLESKDNTFTWRHGDLEDAILSSPNQKLNKEIAKIFGRESLTPKALKDKLRERLTSEQWKDFYSKLLKVEEIKRFIAFLKEKENSQTVDYREPNIFEWKFKNIVYVFIAIALFALLLLLSSIMFR
eukprot:XP_019920644.1 PREDICTED: uncharacterized protein LOC105322826 [Crassostrea gigas]